MLKKNFRLIQVIISAVLLSASCSATASDFSLPFVNAADLGSVYADWATAANDASTAMTNPAGLTRITDQQLVFAALQLWGNTKFTGTTTPPFPPFDPQVGSVTSKIHGTFPVFHYAAPLAKNLVFGFSVTTPFGLGTNYIKNSFVRYSATRSQIVSIDLSPSIGFKLTNQLSAGFGLDVQRLAFTTNFIIGVPPFVPDFESHNDMADWGYGWHGGLLYEVTPCTRIGANYSSQLVFHPNGYSKLYSPLLPGGKLGTNSQRVNMTLPAQAQLSLHHDINNRWSVMGTVFYTDWSVFKKVTLENVMTPTGQTAPFTLPFNYRNAFDYSLGTSFKATNKLTLRTGIQFLGAPSNNHDRIVADPIGPATILGIGAHYQQNCHLGYDIGYTHSFFKELAVNHVAPFGTEFGNMRSQGNVIGIQVTWNKKNGSWT